MGDWLAQYVITFIDGSEKTTNNVTIAESYINNPNVVSIVLNLFDEDGKKQIEVLK